MNYAFNSTLCVLNHGIDFLTTSHFRCHLLILTVLAVAALVPAVSNAQTADSLIKHEYFVQQSADEDLLITINAFEAELESRISGQNREVILRSGYSRQPDSAGISIYQRAGRQPATGY